MYKLVCPQKEQLSVIESFLQSHAESSMFILSNMKRAGLLYTGKDFQGEYLVALDENERVHGVFVQYWNGSLMMQSPNPLILEQLVTQFKKQVRRPVSAVIGPRAQVSHAIELLSLSRHDFAMNSVEGLYALDLCTLPKAKLAEQYQVIVGHAADREVLRHWLKSYEIEALGQIDSAALDARVDERLAHIFQNGDCWVLLASGVPVSLSAFNARLTEMVQVGPVWTPPEYRGRGYARLLVAETLRIAFAEGVHKSILFTDSPAAIKAYQAIGFRQIGDFQLAILRDQVEIKKGV